ncbi:MAG: ligand-binding sensor domain-containing protein, partial [Mucilaginibacter sp.]
MTRIFYLFLAVFVIKTAAFAQSPKISFEHLNMRNGLAREYVGDILQDEKGYIWLGNLTGIARYDGYHFKNYPLTVKGYENTVNTYAYSMFRDMNKTLWAGTLGGNLLRYDPVLDSLIIEKKGANKIGDGYYSTLFFNDRENQIWAVTFKTDKDFYLERYNPQLKTNTKYSRTLKGDQFFAVEQLESYFLSPDGGVMIGARNGFYDYNFKKKRFTGYLTAKDSLDWLNVGGIYRDSSTDNNVWLLANKIKNKTIVLYNYNVQTKSLKTCLSLPGDFPNTNTPIFKDKKGRLWLFTKAGLFLYDKGLNQKTDYLFPKADKDAKDQGVRDILVDRENKFWLATTAGLLYFDPATGQFHRYKANQSDPYALGHIHVNKVFEDRSGLKWVGMDEYGVDRITNLHTAFTAIKNNPEKPGSYPENVTGIALKPDGNYWLTSQLGLFSWDVKTNLFTRVTPPGKKQDGGCGEPQALPNGALCYTDEKGINIYNPSGKIQVIPIPGNEIIANLYEDRKSNIWMLTAKSKFYRLNIERGSLERYAYATRSGSPAKIDTLADQSSSETYEDADGVLWLSNSKIGLSKVDRVKKQIIISPDLQGKALNDINKLYDDKAGHLWIGTNNTGFWQFDKKSQKVVRQVKDDQGVLAGEIRSIAGDKNGNIWITSQRGLAKFNYKNGIVLDYTIANNIPLEVPVNLLTLPDGRFVLCMFNSVLTFNPDEIKSNPVAPQVQVEQVLYSNPKTSGKDEHVLNAINSNSATFPYDQNRITFNYVGLHFVNPAQNKYAYMLEK